MIPKNIVRILFNYFNFLLTNDTESINVVDEIQEMEWIGTII